MLMNRLSGPEASVAVLCLKFALEAHLKSGYRKYLLFLCGRLEPAGLVLVPPGCDTASEHALCNESEPVGLYSGKYDHFSEKAVCQSAGCDLLTVGIYLIVLKAAEEIPVVLRRQITEAGNFDLFLKLDIKSNREVRNILRFPYGSGI